MDIVSEFKQVRDIPYRIPLTPGERDDCCSGKAERLLYVFTQAGYAARYRVCTFRWSDLDMPSELLQVPHEDDCTHVYLEVEIVPGEWKVVDATWDKGVNAILPVNEWDGTSNTMVAVPVRECFSLEQSLAYMRQSATSEALLVDLAQNGQFYQAFNNWLEEQRSLAV